MREIRKRQKSNVKDLILRHIYENFKLYLIVIIIFIIGIVAGVIFINNVNGEQATDNAVTNLQEELQRAQEERQKYLESLGGTY